MGHFFWVSFGQSIWFSWFWIHVLFISDLLTCVCSSLSQNGSQQRGLWLVDISPSWPLRSFLVGKSPWLWEWEILGLLFFIWAGPSLLSIVLLLIFWSFWPQGMNSQLFTQWGWAHLSPASIWHWKQSPRLKFFYSEPQQSHCLLKQK